MKYILVILIIWCGIGCKPERSLTMPDGSLFIISYVDKEQIIGSSQDTAATRTTWTQFNYDWETARKTFTKPQDQKELDKLQRNLGN